MLSEAIKASGSGRNKTDRKSKPQKKNTEVITSYTDSPLFSRKHRFGEEASSSRYSSSDARSSPLLCRKFETGISLLKQFSEARKRKKEENLQLIKVDSQSDLHQTAASETKAPVALHTQALTTLENIISRLRDLDDSHNHRMNAPASPQHNRYPRSSPASPALSKKSKRNTSTSPIRHLLNSPLLNRKNRKKQHAESSDDESHNNSNEDSPGKYSYRDLETFQKAQLRQKVPNITVGLYTFTLGAKAIVAAANVVVVSFSI